MTSQNIYSDQPYQIEQSTPYFERNVIQRNRDLNVETSEIVKKKNQVINEEIEYVNLKSNYAHRKFIPSCPSLLWLTLLGLMLLLIQGILLSFMFSSGNYCLQIKKYNKTLQFFFKFQPFMFVKQIKLAQQLQQQQLLRHQQQL